ncbi:cyclodeaminase/cyclohydrolase family protein [Bradyrhizobium sp. 146]|uniref:cyclodeaminase/cyclohydrolase family protein n=1 Tax=Bradyrhizobium sp. 146 TaxID=2782622 RepID=UPI001FF8AA08|nr:cyclodeaminase/cyclohydrolase family protein [Bradyrhizobium sp. 146]
MTILGGYLGVSLIPKAVRVSRNKKPDAQVLSEVTADMEEAAPKLAHFADADNESFKAYLDAAKLPKASSEEAAARKAGLSAAAEQAAVAAIEAFELGRHLIGRARRAEPDVAPVIRADITAGVELLGAMCIVAKEKRRGKPAWYRRPRSTCRAGFQAGLKATEARRYFSQEIS